MREEVKIIPEWHKAWTRFLRHIESFLDSGLHFHRALGVSLANRVCLDGLVIFLCVC